MKTALLLLLLTVFLSSLGGLLSCLSQSSTAERQSEVDSIVEKSLEAEVCTAYPDNKPPTVVCEPVGTVEP